MLAVYEMIRGLHIAGGAVGLLAMLVPVFSRKGSRWHRRVGQVFAVSMILAGVTGVVMSAAWLAIPSAFVTEAEVASKRVSGLFLATIALLMLCSVQQMLRSLVRKRAPAPHASWLDLALPVASGITGGVSLSVGMLVMAPLLMGFGALTAMGAVGDLRFVLRPLVTPKAWWYQHMQGAMGAMISAITAFTVFGGSRLFSGLVPDALGWVPWVAPTVLILPVGLVWTARWRRRFGEHVPQRPVVAG